MGKVLLLRSNDSSKFNDMEAKLESKREMSLTIVGIVVLLVFILDQLTKFIASRDLAPYGSIEVFPSFFSLTFVKNKGAAFGMFAGLPSPWREISLAVVSIVALGFVIHMLIVESKHRRLPRLALSLILGGACGNLLDRVRFGAVVDFLDFYIGEQHWPAFNVADSSICLGVVLLLLSMSIGKSETSLESIDSSTGAKVHNKAANL